MHARNGDRGIGEAIAVLCAVGVIAAGITFTYARTPVDELYNVSHEGLGGGFGRALVFLNYSAALVAIPVAAIVVARLGGRPAALAGLVAVGLCAVVFWPGVVEQSDLDARAVNGLAAAGVLLTAGLAIAAWRRFGGNFAPPRSLDLLRVAIAIALMLLAVPWLTAMLGISFAGVPAVGSVWQTDELRLQPGQEVPSAAVHAGHHHGLDGVLLALSALALSRMRVTRLRIAVGAYLALMLAYGLANAVQDAWLEQVVKRGWTSREIPSLILPKASLGWAAIVLAAVAFFALGATERARSRR
ncbi:MAG: hypothetical protein ACRDLU_01565 [Gaiellaceae bacterium]